MLLQRAVNLFIVRSFLITAFPMIEFVLALDSMNSSNRESTYQKEKKLVVEKVLVVVYVSSSNQAI